MKTFVLIIFVGTALSNPLPEVTKEDEQQFISKLVDNPAIKRLIDQAIEKKKDEAEIAEEANADETKQEAVLSAEQKDEAENLAAKLMADPKVRQMRTEKNAPIEDDALNMLADMFNDAKRTGEDGEADDTEEEESDAGSLVCNDLCSRCDRCGFKSRACTGTGAAYRCTEKGISALSNRGSTRNSSRKPAMK